jgi:hypothetical protein
LPPTDPAPLADYLPYRSLLSFQGTSQKACGPDPSPPLRGPYNYFC